MTNRMVDSLKSISKASETMAKKLNCDFLFCAFVFCF